MLTISTADGAELSRWLLSDLRVPDQDDSIGEAMVFSRAHPDARLVIADPRTIAMLLPHLPRLASIMAPRPSNLRVWSFIAILAVVVLAGLGFAVWRGPQLLAPLVPESWERGLGDAIADNLAEHLGTCTAAEGNEALRKMATALLAASDYKGPFQVTVVKSKTVNAFALPGGRIVFFDGLIQEAETPDEVAGVFAHELGHVVHRHPMRGLLRQLGLSFLRRLALGGYGDAVDTAAGMGEMMLALRNGREAEREADASALGYLAAAGFRQDGLHEFFARMSKQEDVRGEAPPAILSTHPPLAERLEATQRPNQGRSALDPGDWQALRKICSSHSEPKPFPDYFKGKNGSD